ncbi:FKBP-type peptidyl-prolyl cis-trans isomerase [Demequina activiva]|uniref:Peptidyl-prolyl cis-trans isomerase n=1 Tax=Demequina activiva TaxID=1582364 RepID=A0A919UL81_9MICO|nr:FKBP-type peptidyl-prolyl cis-trans isomerase [Demequina activiva]GIG54463.1 peptidylprolyl isomerase [Demequina activiva]
MRRLAVLAVASVTALALSACSNDSEAPDASASPSGGVEAITVAQSETLAPDIEFTAGLDYDVEETQVLWEGEGEPLVADQALLLDVYGESLVDGTVIINTFDGTPTPNLLSREMIGDAMYDALLGVRVGARVLVVTPPGDGVAESEPIALVVDVLPTRPVGDEVPPAEGMPTVSTLSSGEPQVTIHDGVEPTGDLQVSTLVRGSGPQISPASHVLANYSIVYYADSPADKDAGLEAGEQWAAGDVFDSSWAAEREPLLVDMDEVSAVPGLQQGLLDQTQGSQVMMVVPPSLGYPALGTMVFVVDILDVWNPEG